MLKPHHRSYYIYFENKYKILKRNKRRDRNVRMHLVLKGLRVSTDFEGWHFYFKQLKSCLGIYSHARGERRFLRIEYQNEPAFVRQYEKRDPSTYLKGVKKIFNERENKNEDQASILV